MGASRGQNAVDDPGYVRALKVGECGCHLRHGSQVEGTKPQSGNWHTPAPPSSIMVGEPRRHRGRGNLVREKKSATEFWTSAPLSARPAVIVRNLHLEISIQALVVYGFGSDGLPPEADASSSHFSHTHPPTPRHKISVGP